MTIPERIDEFLTGRVCSWYWAIEKMDERDENLRTFMLLSVRSWALSSQ